MGWDATAISRVRALLRPPAGAAKLAATDVGGRQSLIAPQPTETIAADIAADFWGEAPSSVRRFSTGIAHWVYDVRGPQSEQLVVRLGSADQSQDFVGAQHWSSTLRPLGVPLPAVLASGDWHGLPFVALERLAGQDLGQVYDALDVMQKQRLAQQICHIQGLVASLGEGSGYGYVRLPGDPRRESWRRVIDDSIARSQARIARAGLFDSRCVERLERAVQRFEPYFSRVRPVPFLDDTTTKNVIVHGGELSGVVDVDWICYGDPLLTVALTRTSLLSSGRDLVYTDHWCELLEATAEQLAVTRFYTAVFCVDFLSELGHSFNGQAAAADPEGIERLERLLAEHLHDP
jgi:hypothetical protein